MALPPVPETFTRRKGKIVQELSVPHTEYSDRSPKGTVDEEIRELIDEINGYEGLVTTSSCAGRISVFQEGSGIGSGEIAGVPGGKGGGKFLFVSHEPVVIPEDGILRQVSEIFDGGEGIGGGDDDRFDDVSDRWVPGQRLVRFAFEPMILHIMTASLHHAKPVLSAAINSGFRESGVQSLKNLNDAGACPMVAVRTAGLGLGAIIGSISADEDDEPRHFQPLVTKGHATMLFRIANERFRVNKQRIEKFQVCLRQSMALESEKAQNIKQWESPEVRRQRKRDQGLKTMEATKAAAHKRVEYTSLTSPTDDHGYLQVVHPTE